VTHRLPFFAICFHLVAADPEHCHTALFAYKAKPAKVFRFDEVQDAHRLMESNQANGKIVVRL
jgi:hypothetical protein